MNSDFILKLHSAESDFLTALEHGSQTLTSFNRKWSTLLADLSTASSAGNVPNDTLSLAHLVSSRISIIAGCYLDVKLEEENLSAKLRSDFDVMLQRMDTLNLNPSPDCSHSGSSPDTHSSTLSTPDASTFRNSAYQWLLQNLHNPYPSSEIKAQIAGTSSCPVSSVNSWFTNARRRIGWTALCREHFSSCRADMLDAAYRALVEEDPQRMLSPDIRHSFVAMKVAAEGLHSSTFATSTLTVDLDAVEKGTTDKHKEPVEARKCSSLKLANPGKTAEDSYPSPDVSVAESPVPALDDSLTDESEEEEDVAPQILTGSKRRRSSTEPESRLPSTAERPIKRLRPSTTPQMHLPSPPFSTDGIESLLEAGSPIFSSEHLAQLETDRALRSRKRRTSDPATLKHPGVSIAAPLQIISDPLFCRNIGNGSTDGWFDTNFDALFDMPPPVDASEPDFSIPWEVELFKDYCIPENSKCVPDSPRLPIPHLSEFDGLLHSVASDTYVAPSDGIPLSNINMAPDTAFLDSSIPDMSHIDWASLLNGSDTYQSTINPMFPQYPAASQFLPDIGLSMLRLPLLTPTGLSYGDLASKSAKLGQLHAMQEAVRRMEQELQSEGVVL